MSLRLKNGTFYDGAAARNTDSLGSLTNWQDNLSRLVAVSDYFGRVNTTVYDKEDRPVTRVDARGVEITATYDGLGRLLTETQTGSGTQSYGYTTNIHGATVFTNGLGAVTQFAYNAAGWKTNETFVGVATNSFSYTAAGDLETMRDGKQNLTTWSYEANGRATDKLDARGSNVVHYTYQANGWLATRMTPEKGTTTPRTGCSTTFTMPTGGLPTGPTVRTARPSTATTPWAASQTSFTPPPPTCMLTTLWNS